MKQQIHYDSLYEALKNDFWNMNVKELIEEYNLLTEVPIKSQEQEKRIEELNEFIYNWNTLRVKPVINEYTKYYKQGMTVQSPHRYLIIPDRK